MLSCSLLPRIIQELVFCFGVFNERERTLCPSCPQTPAGGLSTWSRWSCNHQLSLMGPSPSDPQVMEALDTDLGTLHVSNLELSGTKVYEP